MGRPGLSARVRRFRYHLMADNICVTTPARRRVPRRNDQSGEPAYRKTRVGKRSCGALSYTPDTPDTNPHIPKR